LLNLIRDNLRVLYKPPHCRVSGLGSSSNAKDVAGNPTWRIIDFPNTVADNDSMRLLSGINDNEPATGIIEAQTVGHYLASAVISFDHPPVPSPYFPPPYTGYSHVLAVTVRSSPAAAREIVGYMSDAAGDTFRSSVVSVVGSSTSLAGYQWFSEVYSSEGAGEQNLLRDGRIPYFHLTWIGN